MTEMESYKWIGWQPAVIYKGAKKIGYVMTPNEADAICEKHVEYQWELKKKLPSGLVLMTTSDDDTQ
jgi:hypothetical protein